MREIKFRVWDRVNSCFCYCGDISFMAIANDFKKAETYKVYGQILSDSGREYGKSYTSVSSKDKRIQMLPDEKEKYHIQQFTDKLDREGKEIYEGDLVELVYPGNLMSPEIKEAYGLYEVLWNNEFSRFDLKVIKKNWFDTIFRTEEEMKKETIDWEHCPGIIVLQEPLGNYNICRVVGNIYEH